MTAAVVLDTEPLGILTNRNSTTKVLHCRRWFDDLLAAGRRVVIPEIADYEVRRELLLNGRLRGVKLLDGLAGRAEYLPITTAAMRMAAELWAVARSQGRPTAPNPALDGDVILAAQALTLGVPVVVATGNVRHLTRYVAAEAWANVVP